MSTNDLLRYVQREDHLLFGKISGLEFISLREFIWRYSDELEEYYDEDFSLPSGFEEAGDIVIFCMVDNGLFMRTDVLKRRFKNSGKERRDKIKHRYTYDNPMNRIHGFICVEQVNIVEKKALSISLVCSSLFSTKKGIGTDMMNIILESSKNVGYEDIILEVSNEWAEMGIEEEESEEEEEEEQAEQLEEEQAGQLEEDSWVPTEEVIEILNHELWRKTMRKQNDYIPCYNISKDYIYYQIENYLNNTIYECNECKEVEKKTIKDPDDPKGNEYGGFWFRKGRDSQKKLMDFYKRFGFIEDPKVHLEWGFFGDIPLPTMICSL